MIASIFGIKSMILDYEHIDDLESNYSRMTHLAFFSPIQGREKSTPSPVSHSELATARGTDFSTRRFFSPKAS
jgi:hypothetical protein